MRISTSRWLVNCLLALFLLLAIAGCQRRDLAVIKKDNEREVVSVESALNGDLVFINDSDFGLVEDIAMISSVVYCGFQPAGIRPDYAAQSECYKRELQYLHNTEWRSFKAPPELPPVREDRRIAKGLIYDVWLNERLQIAVLAFRGTEGASDLADWSANMRFITNSKRRIDQYEQVYSITPKIISIIRDSFPEMRIFTTGHSLGGGLAQMACFTSSEIVKVFAFNSSPVTGYKDFPRASRPEVISGRIIYQIYESNEILSAFRWPFGRFTKGRKLDIVSVRFNYSHLISTFRMIYHHGMPRLAFNLSSIEVSKDEWRQRKPHCKRRKTKLE